MVHAPRRQDPRSPLLLVRRHQVLEGRKGKGDVVEPGLWTGGGGARVTGRVDEDRDPMVLVVVGQEAQTVGFVGDGRAEDGEVVGEHGLIIGGGGAEDDVTESGWGDEFGGEFGCCAVGDLGLSG